MHRDRALQSDWRDFGTVEVCGPALVTSPVPTGPWAASLPGKCSYAAGEALLPHVQVRERLSIILLRLTGEGPGPRGVHVLCAHRSTL